jgi:ABC transporter substrate binding protein
LSSQGSDESTAPGGALAYRPLGIALPTDSPGCSRWGRMAPATSHEAPPPAVRHADPWTRSRFRLDRRALIAYGPSAADQVRRATVFVDKVLKGAKAGGLPVEQPTQSEFAVNLKTAKALGLTIPQSLLLRADQVIE